MHKSANTGESFNITIGEFSGSLETLLTMVQKRKMHISDVSLVAVADEYIDYIKTLGHVPQQQTAEFIVVAATLLLIKSKSLLPGLELSMEEQEDIEELERRLGLYKIYSNAREMLEHHLAVQPPLHSPARQPSIHKHPSTLKEGSITLKILSGTMQELVDNLPMQATRGQASLAQSVNIRDVMSDLLRRIEQGAATSFTALGGQDRQEVLINFLALLELVKDGVMLAQQGAEHGEILISRESSVI